MTVSFNVEYVQTVYNYEDEGFDAPNGIDSAIIYDALAVVIYEPPTTTSTRTVRVRAFHPISGLVYYDTEVWSGTFFSNYYIIRGSDIFAFGVIYTSTGSPNVGNITLIRASISTVATQTYTSVTGLPGYPAADGTYGYPYFYLGIGNDATDDAIWTVDITDLSRVVTTVAIPSYLTGAIFNYALFRGGAIVAGRGTSTTGTLGRLYWFKIGTGWTDNMGGPEVAARITVASDKTLILRNNSGVQTWLATYDDTAGTFTTEPTLEYRFPNNSDLDLGTTKSGDSDYFLSPDTPPRLTAGYNVYDEIYNDTGLQDPYIERIYATLNDGDYGWHEEIIANPYDPDPIDYNTYLNLSYVSCKSVGDYFIGFITLQSEKFIPPSTVRDHYAAYVITGTFTEPVIEPPVIDLTACQCSTDITQAGSGGSGSSGGGSSGGGFITITTVTPIVVPIPTIGTLPTLSIDTTLFGLIDSVALPTSDDIVDSDTPTVSLI